MAAKTRTIRLQCHVNEKERELVKRNMENIGTNNIDAYIRKMAIDGYVITVDTTDVREVVRLLRIAGNNLNQLARSANSFETIYREDIVDLRNKFQVMLKMTNEIMLKMSEI